MENNRFNHENNERRNNEVVLETVTVETVETPAENKGWKNTAKKAGIVVGAAVAAYGIYRGIKYLCNRNKPAAEETTQVEEQAPAAEPKK